MKSLKLLALVTAITLNLSVSADESLWQDVAPAVKNTQPLVAGISQTKPTKESHLNARTLVLDEASMLNTLQQPQLISLPLPSGEMIEVTIE